MIMASEKQYILSRCSDHPDHFDIQEWDGSREVGEVIGVYSDDMSRVVDDLDQLNQKEVGGEE
jgi:hypothetical protein